MKKSTEAVLLSALVFPGSGHLFLKYYLRGMALLLASLAALTYIMVKAVQQAFSIVDKLQNGQLPLDTDAISRLLAQSSTGQEGLFLDIASYGIALCWLIGIADAYRIARRGDALPSDQKKAESHL